MNEIGVFLDENNSITSFDQARFLKIFEKEKTIWKTKKIIIINGQTEDGCSITTIRSKYKNIINEMDDCKIIIVNKAFGVPYSVFYLDDFSIWDLKGNPFDYFDIIIEKEKEEENRTLNALKESYGVEIENGIYFVDLKSLSISNPEVSSKKAIIPYFENEEVNIVKVQCCHIPPWILNKENKGEIKLAISKLNHNEYNLTIEKLSR